MCGVIVRVYRELEREGILYFFPNSSEGGRYFFLKKMICISRELSYNEE